MRQPILFCEIIEPTTSRLTNKIVPWWAAVSRTIFVDDILSDVESNERRLLSS